MSDADETDLTLDDLKARWAHEQTRQSLRYIRREYGAATAAEEAWRVPGWYEQGGGLP
jgi:hypothetical protein